jgi:hypothetical protein
MLSSRAEGGLFGSLGGFWDSLAGDANLSSPKDIKVFTRDNNYDVVRVWKVYDDSDFGGPSKCVVNEPVAEVPWVVIKGHVGQKAEEVENINASTASDSNPTGAIVKKADARINTALAASTAMLIAIAASTVATFRKPKLSGVAR